VATGIGVSLVRRNEQTDLQLLGGRSGGADLGIAAINAIEELEETAKLYLLLRGAKTHFLTPAQIRELE